jgi:hypothetical protein
MTGKTKYMKEQFEQNRSKEFMLDPNQWPNWPVLPVKRYDGTKPSGFPECAVMVACEGLLTTVFMANMYGLVGESVGAMIRDLEVKRVEYADIDALLDDGWRVD